MNHDILKPGNSASNPGAYNVPSGAEAEMFQNNPVYSIAANVMDPCVTGKSGIVFSK